MQGTEDGWGVHRGNIADATTDGLGLNVEVRLIRISGVPHYGDGLAQLDVITNLDPDAARAEMRHHQIPSATDLHHDVVATLEVVVGRSDLLVWPTVLDKCHRAVGWREYGLAVDVIAG